MTDFQTKIESHFDKTNNSFDFYVGDDLGPAITALLADSEIFPGSDYLFISSDPQPVIGPVEVVFKGNNAVPSAIQNGSSTTFPAELRFYLDGNEEIQLSLDFFVQEKGSTDKFSLIDHFPAVKPVIATMQFDWFNYVISSEKLAAGGVELEIGLNAACGLALGDSGSPAKDNSFSWISFIWPQAAVDELRFGGQIRPPADITTESPTISFASAETPTNMQLGNLSLDAAAISRYPQDAQGEWGVGAEIPLNLPAPFGELVLSGTFNYQSEPEPGSGADPVPDTIELLIKPNKDVASLDPMTGLVGGNSLGTLMPVQFPLPGTLTLDQLGLNVGIQSRSLVNLFVGIRAKVNWTIVPELAKLESVGVKFVLTDPLQFNPLLLSAVVDAELALYDGNNTGELTFYALTDRDREGALKWVFGGDLDVPDDPAKQLNFFGLVNQLFRGFGIGSIEASLLIDELRFSAAPSDQTYSIGVTVSPAGGWSLPLGFELLSLEGEVSANSNGALAGLRTNLLWPESTGPKWTVYLEYQKSGEESAWTFGINQNQGEKLELVKLLNKAFEQWDIRLPDELSVDIYDTEFLYNSESQLYEFASKLDWKLQLIKNRSVGLTAAIDIRSSYDSSNKQRNNSGRISADFQLLSLPFSVAYAFQPSASQIEFEYQQIKAIYSRKDEGGKEHELLTIAFGDRSLGEMLASILNIADPGATTQLDAPWSFLNAINLNGLIVEIDFTDEIYLAKYRLEKDFTLIRIDVIGIEYRKQYGKGAVKLIIEGGFFGKEYPGTKPLSWDPVNESPPAAAGSGKAAFDLRYLAIGQHVSIKGSQSLNTVQAVMQALAGAVEVDDPSDNPMSQLPALEFNAGSNWIIASEFIINRFLKVDIVFNDPEVYGMLITASGPAAGTLKGLSFEILYHKISDDIGQYHIDLTLPQLMRRLQLGAVTVVMPSITVDVFTNGDFKLDLGFPTSPTNFERSFSVEVFPFIGLGGIYIAKLSAETATDMPPIVNGRFNPVVDIGLALSIGLGKTIEVGILSGGISITVNGIVVGRFARFEPNDESLPIADYFKLSGSITIVGKVYAKVDFGIIKASVDIMAYAGVTLLVECHEPMYITLEAGVRVSAGVKIVFVTIRFSFSATIREQFKIGSRSAPPWIVGNPSDPDSLPVNAHQLRYATARQRRWAQRELLEEVHELATASHLNDNDILNIKLWATPLISKGNSTDIDIPHNGMSWSGHTTNSEAAGQDEVVVAAMLFAKAGATGAVSVEDIRSSTEALDDDSVEKLLSRFLLRVFDIESVSKKVSLRQLEKIFDSLQTADFFEDNFNYKNLTDFLEGHVKFIVEPRPDPATAGAQEYAAAFFPMIPELQLTAPGYEIDFGSERIIDQKYIRDLERYFQSLEVDFANDVEKDPDDAEDNSETRRAELAAIFDELIDNGRNPGHTMAGYMFTRYFLSITRSAVQAAINAIRTFDLKLDSLIPGTDPQTASLQSIAALFPEQAALYRWRAHDTATGLSARLGLKSDSFALANDGNQLFPTDGVAVAMRLTAFDIVESNQTRTDLLRAGWPAGEPVQPKLTGVQYIIVSGDILGYVDPPEEDDSISARFNVTVDKLVDTNRRNPALLRPGEELVIGTIQHEVSAGETLQDFANYYIGGDVSAFLDENPDTLMDEQKLFLPEGARDPAYIEISRGARWSTVLTDAANYKVKQDQLLAMNAAILLLPGNFIDQTDVKHRGVGSEWVVPYIYRGIESLEAIVSKYFPNADRKERDRIKREIEKRNANYNFDFIAGAEQTPDTLQKRPPQAGDIIYFAYEETLENVAIYYFGVKTDINKLIVEANIANNTLLHSTTIIEIPPFNWTVSETDSFATIATRYGMRLETLSDTIESFPGIFRDAVVGPPDKAPVALKIEDIPAIKVTDLITYLESYNGFTEAAAQFTRFMLHGLRMLAPEDPMIPASPAVESNEAVRLHEAVTYPLFALIGQEFKAPDSAVESPGIEFENVGQATWLRFDSSAGPSDEKLSFPFIAKEITQIENFATTPLDVSGLESRPLALARVLPLQQSLTELRSWLAAELPAPFAGSGTKAGTPTILPLPDSLQNQCGTPGLPCNLFSCRTLPSGERQQELVDAYAWATLIDIKLATVVPNPSNNESISGLYSLEGADENGKQRLYDIVAALDDGTSAASIYLLYQADPSDDSSGYRADLTARTNTQIIKTNLSTISHNVAPTETGDTEIEVPLLLGNTSGQPYSTDFENASAKSVVQLLWQNSVTRSGGFYLKYVTEDGAALPDWLFDSEGFGKLSLMIMLDSQFAVGTDLTASLAPALLPFNNIAVVAAAIDPSQETLVAEAVIVGVDDQTTLTTLGQSGPSKGLTPDQLIARQADIPDLLRIGTTVNTSDPATQPVKTQAIKYGDTWQSVSTHIEVSLTDLATFNVAMPVFRNDAYFPMAVDKYQIQAVTPPGTVGFEIQRSQPTADNYPDEFQCSLQELFNLSGFAVSDSAGFRPSGQGLPVGPSEKNSIGSLELGLSPTDHESDGNWYYKKALRISKFARHRDPSASQALPSELENPYAGIDLDVSRTDKVYDAILDVALQDVMGNRTSISESISIPPIPVGYTDELVGLTQWPSIASAYTFDGSQGGSPDISVTAAFTPGKYLPIPGASFKQTHDAVRVDHAFYKKLYYQVWADDIEFTVNTSMGTTSTGDSDQGLLNRARLRDLSIAAYIFLSETKNSKAINVSSSQTQKLSDLANDHDLSPGDLVAANGKEKARNCFAEGSNLNWPLFISAKVDDSLACIVAQLEIHFKTILTVEQLAEKNPSRPLNVGTVISSPARTWAFGAGKSISLKTVTEKAQCSPVSNHDADVRGLFDVEANRSITLQGNQNLQFNDLIYTTKTDKTDLDTMDSVVHHFHKELNDQVVLSGEDEPAIIPVTSEDVVVQNPNTRFFSTSAGEFEVPNYVFATNDTLKTVARKLEIDIETIAAGNANVDNFLSAGTKLHYGIEEYPLGKVSEDTTLTELAESFGGLNLSELGAWQANVDVAADHDWALPDLLDTTPVQYGVYHCGSDDSFGNVLNATPGFDKATFLLLNGQLTGLFRPGETIYVDGADADTCIDSSFESLAIEIGIDPGTLFDAVKNEDGLVRPYAICITPTLKTETDDTFVNAANRIGVDPADLAAVNASTRGLLAPGKTLKYEVSGQCFSESVGKFDSIGKVAERLMQQINRYDPAIQITAANLMSVSENKDFPLNEACALLPPIPEMNISAPVVPTYEEAIRSLWVRSSIGRHADLVNPEFAAASKVKLATTELQAEQLSSQEARDNAGQSLSLQKFATNFQSLFAGFLLATGHDSGRGESATTNGALWAAYFSNDTTNSQRFSYRSASDAVGYFAPGPLSTELWNSAVPVPVQAYESGTGLSPDAQEINVQGADIDQYARRFLETFDGLLSPLAAKRLLEWQIEDQDAKFDTLVGWKEQLATAIKDRVTGVLGEASLGNIELAKDAMHERLLTELSQAYKVDTILQIPFVVDSPCADPTRAARMSGKLMCSTQAYTTPDAENGVTLLAMAEQLGGSNIEYLIDQSYLVEVIDQLPNIANVGAVVESTIDAAKKHEISAFDTLNSIAAALDLPCSTDLVDKIRIEDSKGLLAKSTTLNISKIIAGLADGAASISDFAEVLDVLTVTMLRANKHRPLLKPGTTISLDVQRAPVTVPGAGTPSDILEAYKDIPDSGIDSFATLAAAIAETDWICESTLTPIPYTFADDLSMLVFRVPPVFSFSSGKLSLANTDAATPYQYSTVFLDVQNPASSRFLSLDLAYRFNESECNIATNPALSGEYQQSDWLTYVLPVEFDVESSANYSDVGSLKIPVPLREYPKSGVVTEQIYQDSAKCLRKADFKYTWDYIFSMTRPFAAQDLQTMKVSINVPYSNLQTDVTDLVDKELLFAELYKFHFVADTLCADLALLELPELDADQLATAKVAVKSFMTIASSITTAWAQPTVVADSIDDEFSYVYTVRLLTTDDNPGCFGTFVLEYVSGPTQGLFAVERESIEFDMGQLGIDHAHVLFSKAGYTLSDSADIYPRRDEANKELVAGEYWLNDPELGRTYRIFTEGDLIKIEIVIVWPEIAVGISHPWKTDFKWEKLQLFGQVAAFYLDDPWPISEPFVVAYKFAGLDILACQNATGSSSVSRNKKLLFESPTNIAFEYQSPEAYFPGIVTPLIQRDNVDLKKVTGDNVLLECLSTFFDDLTESVRDADAGRNRESTWSTRSDEVDSSILRMSLRNDFKFALNKWETSAVRSPALVGPPMLFSPDINFNVLTDWKQTGDTFVVDLNTAVTDRSGELKLPENFGRYTFDLQVYSSIENASQTVPLVDIRNIYFDRNDEEH